MESINIGKTDLKISRVGIGTWAIGGFGWGRVSDDDSLAAIRRAWDSGINFFDTADVYGQGHAEEILAKALGRDRGKAVIATKFGVAVGRDGKTYKDISPRHLTQALEGSLRRLKLDCIPLYQIHWPDGVTPVCETMAALEKFREQGKIRHIGYSNFSAGLLLEAESCGRGESLQQPYNLIDRRAEDYFDVCRKSNLTLLTYGPLSQGLLSGRFGRDSKFDKDDIRSRYPDWQGEKFIKNLALAEAVRQIGEKYGKTAAQTAIRWVLDRNAAGAVLVGVTHPDQVAENLAALDWHLSDNDVKVLSSRV